MSTLSTYNGLQVAAPPPANAGGKAINDNFIALSTHQDTADPTPDSDSSEGFAAGSRWFNTSTGAEWICNSAAIGSAIWSTIHATASSLSGDPDIFIDSTPTDGGIFLEANNDFIKLTTGDGPIELQSTGGPIDLTSSQRITLNAPVITLGLPATYGYPFISINSDTSITMNSPSSDITLLASGNSVSLGDAGFVVSSSGEVILTSGPSYLSIGGSGSSMALVNADTSGGTTNITGDNIVLAGYSGDPQININGNVYVNTPSSFRINGSGNDILVFGGGAGFTITTNSYGGMSLGTDGYQLATQGSVLNLNSLEFGVLLASGDALNLGADEGFGLSGSGYSLSVSEDSFGVTTAGGAFGLGPDGFGITVPDGSSMGISNVGAGIQTAGGITLVSGTDINLNGNGVFLTAVDDFIQLTTDYGPIEVSSANGPIDLTSSQRVTLNAPVITMGMPELYGAPAFTIGDDTSITIQASYSNITLFSQACTLTLAGYWTPLMLDASGSYLAIWPPGTGYYSGTSMALVNTDTSGGATKITGDIIDIGGYSGPADININGNGIILGAVEITLAGNVQEGSNTVAGGLNSHAGGNSSIANKMSQWARSGGDFVSAGDAQHTITYLRYATTDASVTELTLDGNSPSGTTEPTSNRFIAVPDKAYDITLTLTGKQQSSTNVASYCRRFILLYNSGTSTIAIQNVATIGTDLTPSGWGSPVFQVDTSNLSLQVLVTGQASTNINWHCVVEANEITF